MGMKVTTAALWWSPPSLQVRPCPLHAALHAAMLLQLYRTIANFLLQLRVGGVFVGYLGTAAVTIVLQ